MSAENVELVLSLQLDSGVDVATLVNDDEAAAGLRSRIARLFHTTVECTMRLPGMAPVAYSGLDGLRLAWRDWLMQWASYRVEVEDVIDRGVRVVVVVRGHGQREPGAQEVTRRGATVWTLRDRRISSVDFNVPYGEAVE